MKRVLISLLFGCATLWGFAQQPLYIVNGQVREQIEQIPPSDIEQVEVLPADEESIATYGPTAANGVMLITLRYDEPARFLADSLPYSDYIAQRVKWGENDPVARVVLIYRITPSGKAVYDREVECTDSRLKRRILKAMEQAPPWEPARKNGQPIESEGTLHIQLPKGKRMPVERVLVYG